MSFSTTIVQGGLVVACGYLLLKLKGRPRRKRGIPRQQSWADVVDAIGPSEQSLGRTRSISFIDGGSPTQRAEDLKKPSNIRPQE